MKKIALMIALLALTGLFPLAIAAFIYWDAAYFNPSAWSELARGMWVYLFFSFWGIFLWIRSGK